VRPPFVRIMTRSSTAVTPISTTEAATAADRVFGADADYR